MNELRVGDLVDLPPVRTVIQLADLANERLAAEIVEDFVLTADCDFVLTALLDAMTGEEGQGFFLQGNFGSGKSHLLAVLELLFREDQAWNVLVRQEGRYRKLQQALSGTTTVAAVSLVEHAGSERLEDICLGALDIGPASAAEGHALEEIRAALENRHQGTLEAFLGKRGVTSERLFDVSRPDLLDDLVRELDLPFRVRRNRGAVLDALEAHLAAKETPSRALLIIDELSEFLRSKPDARAFNEDIRFLQFLGEASRRMPLFVVASLQEHIETTGEIDQTAFGKIKDRYPTRLSLTGTHVRELASARLIRKKPGAEAQLAELYRKFRTSFSGFDLSENDFIALYPVHPATVELLDDLLPLFSRHRGAVDFLHYQLAGDPTRHIAGLASAPAESLLGPETILDHFRVRIQETLETSPYLTVVLAFYEKELARLFAEPEARETALRLVKILILLAISPVRRRRNVAELAEMLLKSITTLESSANYDYVRDLLEKMRLEGAYLAVESGKEPTGDVYSVDLAADVQLIIKRRIESLLNDPGFSTERAIATLLPHFQSPELPLASFASAPISERRVAWQKTRREGILLFCRDENDPLLSDNRLDEITEKLFTTESDFCIVVMAPSELSDVPERLLARLEDHGPKSYLIWLPAPLASGPASGPASGKDQPLPLVRRTAARLVVRERFRVESTDVAKRVLETLEPLIEEELELSENVIQRAYRSGRFLAPAGSPPFTPAELPTLPFDRILDRLAEFPLAERFPDHYQVAPTLELPGSELATPLLLEFFRAGEVETHKLSQSFRQILDAILKPLGLVRRTATGLRLQPDPSSSELVHHILDRIGEARIEREPLERELRKGRFGLTRSAFDLTILGLTYSGQLTAYASGRKVSLDTLDLRSVARIQELGPGEMLSRDLQKVLATLPFVPPRLRQGTFGFAQQRELWELATKWKSDIERRGADLEAEIDRARAYRSAAELDLDALAASVERMVSIAKEVKVSYSAREGLERLARRAREEPELAKDVERFDELARFFADDWERYLFVRRYLADPALRFRAEHAELATTSDRLRELANRPDLPFAPELNRKLKDDMQSFLSEYGAAYEREHRTQKSKERVEPLLQLREGKGYGLLRRLAGIALVSVDDDLVTVDRVLDEALAKTCERLSPELLRSKPTCECGFRLGDTLAVPPLSKVQESVDRGIVQYLERLREPGYREPIASALHGLAEVGKDSLVSKIRALYELELEGAELLKRANKLVTSDVVDALNDGLAGHAVLVERSLEELTARIGERSFPRAKLLAIVTEWIDGGASLGPEDYVKVVSEGKTTEGGLQAFVRERFPELASWWNELGERKANRAMVFAYRGEPPDRADGVEPRIVERLAEAFGVFVSEQPDKGVDVLDAVERELEAKERTSLLSGDRGADAESLVRRAYGERAFRFAVRERGKKLIQMVTAGSLAKLPSFSPEAPEPIAHRLGLDALSRALCSAVEVRDATRALQDRASSPPDTVETWERHFRSHLSPLPSALCDLEEAVRELKLEVDLSGFTTAARAAVDEASSTFESFYLAQSSSWGADSRERPNMLSDVFSKHRDLYGKKLQAASERFVFMDGMRWDVWSRLWEALLPRLNTVYRVVDEVPLWSIYPTTTKVQLDAAGIGLPELALAAEPTPGYGTSSQEPPLVPGFLRLRGPGGECIDRLNLVDEKIHESSLPLSDVFREIELHARRSLAVLLDEAPRGTLVFLFSDHGFRENPRWTHATKHHESRYRHGGASPFEVITPLVILYRGGG